MLDLISPFGVSVDEQDLSHFAACCEVWLFIDEDDQIHSFRDELLLRSGGCLGDQTLQTNEATKRIVGVDRGHPTGMPGVPRFQERVRLSSPNFAHDDTRRL